MTRGPGDVRVEEVAEPTLPRDGVVVAVEAAGLCAADRMLWTGHHPWGDIGFPIVQGHELLGRVVATDRADLPVGTRVTAEVKVPCGRCAWCRRAEPHLCPHGAHLGSGLPGAFAERLALPGDALVHRVPEALTTEQAVLAEPLACVLHAVRRTPIHPGDRLLVAGLGGLGALAPVAARAEGARTVTALVRSPAKAVLALELGYDSAVLLDDLGSPGDPGGVPDAGDRFDAGLDLSGDPDAVLALLAQVRTGGRVGVYGVYTRPLLLDLNQLGELGGRSLSGGHLAPDCFPDAIALLGSVDAGRVVSGRHPLDDVVGALTASHPLRLKEIVCPT